jgi:hypothetical protein
MKWSCSAAGPPGSQRRWLRRGQGDARSETAQKAAAAKTGVLLGGEVLAMVRFHGFVVASARCVAGWIALVCSARIETLAF